MSPRRARAICGAALLAGAQGCTGARTYEQSYLRARDNWEFRRGFARADRLFNAFDYGHAILAETFIAAPAQAPSRLEGPVYRFVVCRVLASPPNVPLEERAIAPRYGAMLPEAVETFRWAHMLHRQLYDILGDERLTAAEQDRQVLAALRHYQSRPDLALSAAPKGMELMEGQPYSLAFRRVAPRFNRLIWSYHWLQMVLYDALLDGGTREARDAAVRASVDAFFAMLDDSVHAVPTLMPMSAAIAPHFSTRYPEAAIIFDNLHSLHDVVSDVLASEVVAPAAKRAAVLAALERFRDSTSSRTSRDEWVAMAQGMGLAEMGGPAPMAGSAGRPTPRPGC